MDADIIIVGGGLSGLVAGAKLARTGRDVRILERAAHLGGRARSVALGGRAMNLGPHALYRGGPAWRALTELGVEPRGFTPTGRGAAITWDGRAHPLPAGPLSLALSGLFTLSDKLALARFLARPERAALADPGSSVASMIASVAASAPAAAFLEALVRVSSYTNAPSHIDAASAAAQLARVARSGVLYVDGGWQRLVDGVSEVASRRGVRVEQARVVGAEASGRVTLDDGATLSARHVLLALPAAGLRALAPSLAPPPDAIASRAACLDLVVDALPIPSRRFVLGLDAPHYCSVHTPPEATGPLAIQVAKYLAPIDNGASARVELEAWLEVAHPGLLARASAVRFLPEMTVQSAVPTAGRAPVARSEGALFAVGDHAAPGFLLDAALASVDNVCAELGAAATSSPRAA